MEGDNKELAIKAMEQMAADLRKRIHYLEESIAIMKGIDKVSESPNSLKHSTSVSMANYSDYNKTLVNKEKAAYILKKLNRFLHVREFYKVFAEIEGIDLDNKKSLESIRNGLANLKAEGRVVSYKAGASHQSTYWGSPKWLDGEGKPKKEYMFVEDVQRPLKKNEIIDL